MNKLFKTVFSIIPLLLSASLHSSQAKNSSISQGQMEQKIYVDTQEMERLLEQTVNQSQSSSSCSSHACSAIPIKTTDAEKLCDLGNALRNDGERLYPAALCCYKQAAEDLTSIRGRARALCNLGLCHENGYGVKVNQEEALEYFRESANSDKTFAPAQYNLFRCYYKGIGTKANQQKSLEYLKRAADLGHTDALYEQGAHWQAGTFGRVDMQEAVRCYRAAIAGTKPSLCALYNLASCYERGWGVEENQKQAVELYRQAADKGSPDATRNLAHCLMDGRGVNKNLRQAFQKYKEAAIAGDAYAQLLMARAYQRGIMVKKNSEKEAAWLSAYEKTTNKNNDTALRELNANASFFTTGIEIDIAGDVCPICQNEIAQGDEIRILSCLHVVCKGCLNQWYPEHHSCPICRTAQRCVTGTALSRQTLE